jgi:hypothetical protein
MYFFTLGHYLSCQGFNLLNFRHQYLAENFRGFLQVLEETQLYNINAPQKPTSASTSREVGNVKYGIAWWGDVRWGLREPHYRYGSRESPSGTVKTGKWGKGLVLQVGGLRWASNPTYKNIVLAAPQMALWTKEKLGVGAGWGA